MSLAIAGLGLAAAAFFSQPVFAQTILVMSDIPSLALVSLSAYVLYRKAARRRRSGPVLAGAIFGFLRFNTHPATIFM